MDKEVSSKPVAWWTGEFNDEADDFMFDKTKQNHMNHINSRTHEFFPIPLYTHPVKQLSDEEIEVIVKAWFNCHPEESLTSEFLMPLYSVVNLCKKLRK